MSARALIIAAVLLFAPIAQATTVLQVDMNELTLTSQWVVRATVLTVTNVDLTEQGQSVFTDYELVITDVFRGRDVPVRYTLRMPGGSRGDGAQLKIPGMPVLAAGQDVVLFLERTSLGHVPTGLGQGVWPVITTPSGDEWVQQVIGSVHLMRRNAAGRLEDGRPELLPLARPVEDLAAEVLAVEAAYPNR
jgi:hypothetical protein